MEGGQEEVKAEFEPEAAAENLAKTSQSFEKKENEASLKGVLNLSDCNLVH